MTRTQEEIAELLAAQQLIADHKAELVKLFKATVDRAYHAEFEQQVENAFDDLSANTVEYWLPKLEEEAAYEGVAA